MRLAIVVLVLFLACIGSTILSAQHINYSVNGAAYFSSSGLVQELLKDVVFKLIAMMFNSCEWNILSLYITK